MSTVCFVAVVLDEGSDAGGALNAHVARIARRVGVGAGGDWGVGDVGDAFSADADFAGMITGRDGPEPRREAVTALVRALLGASDVAAVRVAWRLAGARPKNAPRSRPIEIVVLDAIDAHDWDRHPTVEVRRGATDRTEGSLKEIALGIS